MEIYERIAYAIIDMQANWDIYLVAGITGCILALCAMGLVYNIWRLYRHFRGA